MSANISVVIVVLKLTIRRREKAETFKWSEVRRGIFSPQLWFTATAYFGILAGLYSFGLFVSFLVVYQTSP